MSSRPEIIHVRFTSSELVSKYTTEFGRRCPKCGRRAAWLHVSIVDGHGKYKAEHARVIHRGIWTKAMEAARREAKP